jgi:hypothetical protein
VGLTSRNSQAENQAVVAELAAASPGARSVARRQEGRNSFNLTRAVESVIYTPHGLEGATADTGVTWADMAVRLNDANRSGAIAANLTG